MMKTTRAKEAFAEDAIIRTLNRYKVKSTVPIVDQQIAYIPMLEPNQIQYSCQDYLIDGSRRVINQAYQVCLKLNYLRRKPILPREHSKYRGGIWPLTELVENDVLLPFMLFINGKYAPMDRIDIAIGQENYYAIFNAGDDKNDSFINMVRQLSFAQIVLLPDNMSFVPDYPAMDDKVVFAFDKNGNFIQDTTSGIIKYAITNNTDYHHTVFKWWFTTSGINAFPVFENTDIKITPANIFVFEDGIFKTGTRTPIIRAFDGKYIEEDGDENECLTLHPDDDPPIVQNRPVTCNSVMVTVGDGTANGTKVAIGAFANYIYTPTADNINKLEIAGIQPVVQQANAGSPPVYYENLNKPFEMKYDKNKAYAENVTDGVRTLLSYNYSLFNHIYEAASNIYFEEHPGTWITQRENNMEQMCITRRPDEYILMFVNGEVYRYHRLIKYKPHTVYLPIRGINDDDLIEIVRFRYIDNNIYDVVINEDDGFMDRSPKIFNDQMLIFSDTYDQTAYDFPEYGLQHFPVEFKLETNERGQIKVTFDNPFFYGRKLKIAFRNRYQHFAYDLKGTTSEYSVDLKARFMYCSDYSKYMVFKNGRLLDKANYRLTLPMRPTTPFSEFKIYLNMPIMDGDTLDVVYSPTFLQEIINTPDVPTSGDIVVDKSILSYGLANTLYMVWVNGKKIAKSQISDIDATHMRIQTNQDSVHNFVVTKYTPDLNILPQVFKDTDSLWDQVFRSLTPDEVNRFLGIITPTNTNTEANIYDGAVPIKSIMYELIREEYIMNPRVDTTGPFVYDYQDVDDTVIEEISHAGGSDTAIIDVMNGDKQDNLNDVERPWP